MAFETLQLPDRRPAPRRLPAGRRGRRRPRHAWPARHPLPARRRRLVVGPLSVRYLLRNSAQPVAVGPQQGGVAVERHGAVGPGGPTATAGRLGVARHRGVGRARRRGRARWRRVRASTATPRPRAPPPCRRPPPAGRRRPTPRGSSPAQSSAEEQVEHLVDAVDGQLGSTGWACRARPRRRGGAPPLLRHAPVPEPDGLIGRPPGVRRRGVAVAQLGQQPSSELEPGHDQVDPGGGSCSTSVAGPRWRRMHATLCR